MVFHIRSILLVFLLVRLVFIGGGNGLSTVLKGFRDFPGEVSAVVTVFDSGGSSGILRKLHRFYPPGDIRRCLVSLAHNKQLADLFEHRFNELLFGHSLGNLILLALSERAGGNFIRALEDAHRLLDVRGRILPVSLDFSELVAEFEDGSAVLGEDEITRRGEAAQRRIKRVWLVPEAKVYEGTARAILEADVIVMGPGSLYTSIIPNLLVKGVPEAIRESHALKIYISNIATQRGETDNYRLSDHYYVLKRYLGFDVDLILANNNFVVNEVVEEEMFSRGVTYVPIDKENVGGVEVIEMDLVDEGKPWRHSPRKTRTAIEGIINERLGVSRKMVEK